MIRSFLFCLVLLCTALAARCQDMIIKAAGDTVRAKVLRVSPSYVSYRQGDGAEVSVLKDEVNIIVYANGTADTFSLSAHSAGGYVYKDDHYISDNLAVMGEQDAMRYYRSYKVGKNVMLYGSVFMPFYTLVPTIVIANVKPKDWNLNYPYPELMNQREYGDAYMAKAFQIKRRKTWSGFFIGTGIIVGTYGLLIGAIAAASSHH